MIRPCFPSPGLANLRPPTYSPAQARNPAAIECIQDAASSRVTAAGDVTSGEPGTELGTEPVLETNSTAEGATEEDSVESSERLREAALNAAVTLDEAASWMHSMAAGLRAWAGE